MIATSRDDSFPDLGIWRTSCTPAVTILSLQYFAFDRSVLLMARPSTRALEVLVSSTTPSILRIGRREVP
jgi:hypothetical protein